MKCSNKKGRVKTEGKIKSEEIEALLVRKSEFDWIVCPRK